jgi:hypothetical protein
MFIDARCIILPAPGERNVYRCAMHFCSLAPAERHLLVERCRSAGARAINSTPSYKHFAPLELEE